MLSVRRGAEAVNFYKAAFGAAELICVDDSDGNVVAQLSIDGAEFWVADESPDHQNFSPETIGGGSVRMILTVDYPDAVFDIAVVAGAEVAWRPADSRGWRVGRVVDPFGQHREIGEPL